MILRLLLCLLLLPSLAHATTWYVASGGSASCATGANNISAPLGSISAGQACLTGGGDTLLIRGGTYTGTFTTPSVSGTSWLNPVWVGAYPGETVTLRGIGGDHVLAVGGGGDYVIFDHLRVSAPSGQQFAIAAGGSGGHVRFQYGDVTMDPYTCTLPYTGSAGYNIFVNPGATEVQFLGNDVHNAPCGYGFYVHASNRFIRGRPPVASTTSLCVPTKSSAMGLPSMRTGSRMTMMG
jgi:hypothetical protein